MNQGDKNMGPLDGTFDETEDQLTDAREQVTTINVERREDNQQGLEGNTQNDVGLTTGGDMGTADDTGSD